jgi:putative transposase
MNLALEARKTLPTRRVCTALELPPASLYRRISGETSLRTSPTQEGKTPNYRALSPQERQVVLDTLHSEQFMDDAPAQVYAKLLGQGVYLCSQRTMYRVLAANGEAKERRRQTTHPKRKPPELVATAPHQVWTWDITHLKTFVRGKTIKLYVVIDLFSRFVVGWYLSETETSVEARHLFKTLAQRYCLDMTTVTIHADNGSPMRGKPLDCLFEELGVTKSHSRPRTSNDNAFSESQFKTMKYRPTYPDRFVGMEQAREWCREFFPWYNNDHHHEGLALLTPADVFDGKSEQIVKERNEVLLAAYQANPQRFVNGTPSAKSPPKEVTINPPTQNNSLQEPVSPQEVTK